MPTVKCSICLQQFDSDHDFQQHVDDFQGRALELLEELQQCLAHKSSKPHPSASPSPTTRLNTRPITTGNKRKGSQVLQCPHVECEDKRKTRFGRRKDLVRHYTTHVECCELCVFCQSKILRVRQYVTHYDGCQARLNQIQDGTLSPDKTREAILKRQELTKAAADHLQQALETASPNEEETTPKKRRLVDEDAGIRKKQFTEVFHPTEVSDVALNPNPSTSGKAITTSGLHTSSLAAVLHTTDSRDTNTTVGVRLLPADTQFEDIRTAYITAPPSLGLTSQCNPSVPNPMEYGQGGGEWGVSIHAQDNSSNPTMDIQSSHERLLPRAPVVLSYTIDEPYNFAYRHQDSTAVGPAAEYVQQSCQGWGDQSGVEGISAV